MLTLTRTLSLSTSLGLEPQHTTTLSSQPPLYPHNWGSETNHQQLDSELMILWTRALLHMKETDRRLPAFPVILVQWGNRKWLNRNEDRCLCCRDMCGCLTALPVSGLSLGTPQQITNTAFPKCLSVCAPFLLNLPCLPWAGSCHQLLGISP